MRVEERERQVGRDDGTEGWRNYEWKEGEREGRWTDRWMEGG